MKSDNEKVTIANGERDESSHRGWWRSLTRTTRIALASAAAVFTLLAACALAYGLYYGAGHRALPGTWVGSTSVSGKTHGEIVALLEKTEKTKTLTVTGNGIHEKSAHLADMGIKANARATADKALKNNSSIGKYFTAPFTDTRIEPDVTWDQRRLTAFSTALTTNVKDMFKATEPSVAPDDKSGKFVTVAGKNGRGVPPSELVSGAKRLLGSGSDYTLKANIGPIEPMLTRADAQKLADQANTLISSAVSVKSGDVTAVPDPKQRMSWVSIPAVGEAETSASLVPEKIKEWATAASSNLAVKRVDGSRYVNERGETVLERVKAVDGVNVTNIDAIVKGIIEAITNKQPFTGAFETTPDKAEWKETVIAPGAENLAYPAAPGEKWIDVNLSNRTTTAYEGATVVRGPVPMVPGGPQTPTITGTYTIQRKLLSDTMKGFNPDGTPYRAENVPYAMYFHSGYALHGAPWRSTFGPGAPGGSHGCINMPVGEAGWFYQWAPPGTVVVSHF